jgi:hypothetical protein
MPQRLNRIQPCGLAGGEIAEDDTHGSKENERDGDGARVEDGVTPIRVIFSKSTEWITLLLTKKLI